LFTLPYTKDSLNVPNEFEERRTVVDDVDTTNEPGFEENKSVCE